MTSNRGSGNWWDLDITNPEVARWVMKTARNFPWCYWLEDAVHLVDQRRDENGTIYWVGTWCGYQETPEMKQSFVIRRYIPDCQRCIEEYDRRLVAEKRK